MALRTSGLQTEERKKSVTDRTLTLIFTLLHSLVNAGSLEEIHIRPGDKYEIFLKMYFTTEYMDRFLSEPNGLHQKKPDQQSNAAIIHTYKD